jgi:hypothetical protein
MQICLFLMRQVLLLSTGLPLPLPANVTGEAFIDDMASKISKEVKSLASDQIKAVFQGVEEALQPNREGQRVPSSDHLKGLTDASYQALYSLLQSLEEGSAAPSWRPLRTGLEFVGPSRADGVSHAWVSPAAREEFMERGRGALKLS